MKNLIILWLIIIISGCQTASLKTVDLTQDDRRILRNVNTMDTLIIGTYATDINSDLSGFTEKDFTTQLGKGKSDAKKEMRTIFSKLSHKSFTAYKNTFIFCAYDAEARLAFCDDAACEIVEESLKTTILPDWSIMRSRITPGVCREK